MGSPTGSQGPGLIVPQRCLWAREKRSHTSPVVEEQGPAGQSSPDGTEGPQEARQGSGVPTQETNGRRVSPTSSGWHGALRATRDHPKQHPSPRSLQVPPASQSLLFKTVLSFLLMLQKANETLSEIPRDRAPGSLYSDTSDQWLKEEGPERMWSWGGSRGGSAHAPFLLVDEQQPEGTSWIRVS